MTDWDRRRVLRLAGVAGLGSLSGCTGLLSGDSDETRTSDETGTDTETNTNTDTPTDTATSTDTDTATETEVDEETIEIDPLETDRLVGTHYYPWFGEMAPSNGAYHEGWTEESTLTPVLGEYDSHDPDVVERHVKWCLEHGIQWLSVSWWGPDRFHDDIIREGLMETDRFRDIQFSILYESVGRFGKGGFDIGETANRERLTADLEYMQDQFFGEDNYLHIDDRPVLFLYSGAGYQGDVSGVFDEVTEAVGVDPYIIADVPPELATDLPVSQVADAVTTYNPYNSRPDIQDVFHDLYENQLASMNLGASAGDVDFVPAIIPGFDDTEIEHVPRDNPPLPPSPGRFERCCDQLSPHLADAEAVLITSFNEWFESTCIEPTEEAGTAYLELTAQRLATGESTGFDPDGTLVEFDWGTSVTPDGSDRSLSFLCGQLKVLDADGNALDSYDIGSAENEPHFVAGAYPPESNDGHTWRWLGTPSEQTTILFDHPVDAIGGFELYGRPATEMEVVVRTDLDTATLQLREDDRPYRIVF